MNPCECGYQDHQGASGVKCPNCGEVSEAKEYVMCTTCKQHFTLQDTIEFTRPSGSKFHQCFACHQADEAEAYAQRPDFS